MKTAEEIKKQMDHLQAQCTCGLSCECCPENKRAIVNKYNFLKPIYEYLRDTPEESFSRDQLKALESKKNNLIKVFKHKYGCHPLDIEKQDNWRELKIIYKKFHAKEGIGVINQRIKTLNYILN